MNIAIFGDSFANGESDMTHHLAHLGLTQYLMDDGHFVINFSRQGNSNSGTIQDFSFNIRQNEHIKWDIAIVFQTEPCREDMGWIDCLRDEGIRKVESAMARRLYSQLKEVVKPFSIPIYLVGGTIDLLEPKEVEKFGFKCACQSLVNLCVNGKHTIEEPVTNFVFPIGTGWRFDDAPNSFFNKANKIIKGTNDKEHFLKLIEVGENRYKLMEDNPKYFAPEENLTGKAKNPVDHPNRYAYKKLFNHLKSEGVV
jgi:hypothetical protein